MGLGYLIESMKTRVTGKEWFHSNKFPLHVNKVDTVAL